MEKENYFAGILKKLMDEKNIKQIELSENLEVRQSQVSNWLNAKSIPGFYSIKRIAQYFNVSADYLLGLKEAK